MANGNKGEKTTVYASLVAGTGLTGWIIALPEPVANKVMYLSILAIGGFAAGITRFILHMYAQQMRTNETVLMQISDNLAKQNQLTEMILQTARQTQQGMDMTSTNISEAMKIQAVHGVESKHRQDVIITHLTEMTKCLIGFNGSTGLKKVKKRGTEQGVLADHSHIGREDVPRHTLGEHTRSA